MRKLVFPVVSATKTTMRNPLRLLFSCLLVVLLLPPSLRAQERSITGFITNDQGGLAGVTVKVKGTTRATQTTNDGRYAINAKKGDVLQFSFVGYTDNEATVGDNSVISLKLVPSDANALNDVVVVGYATQRKGNLTGAVSTVDVAKTLKGRPVADVGRGLQGAASGLSITVASAEVGSDPLIKIRGQIGSLQGGSAPLILLDNVEIPSIQVVNPADIASVTILKDAASASIYGSKASFGVVLITTKKGSTGSKPSIYYSNNFSWQNVWKDLQMGTTDALKYTVDAAERIGTVTPTGAFYLVDRASWQKAVAWQQKYGGTIGPNDPTVFGRDWFVQGANLKMGVRTYDPYQYMIKEWAPTQQHDFSVGLTQGKTSYNIGLGLLDQSGMIKPAKKDEFTKYNVSLKIQSELSKYFTIRAGGLYSRRNKQYPYATNSTTADPWYYIYRWSSLYPFGNDENGDPIRSPVSEYGAANTASILTSYSNYNLGATVNIMNNWKVDFDYTYSLNDETWFRPGTRFTARDSWVGPVQRVGAGGAPVYVDNTGAVVTATTPGAMLAYDLTKQTYTALGANPDHIARTATNFVSHTINAFTTYSLNLKQDHAFKFIAGINRVSGQTEFQTSQITTLSDINNPQFPFATGTQTSSGGKSWDAQLGYFARVNYAYKNKYLLEGNIRYDGSSKFPTHLRWRWYPSVSAGWVATEEKFMDFIKPVVNNLKVRGSWGMIGDQSVPGGLYISSLPGAISNWVGAGGQRLNQVGTPTAVSSDIAWQDIVSSNLGIDMGILNNKVNISFDLFERKTDHMIVSQEGIPLTLGVGAPLGNYGALTTRGWELTVDFNHTFKNGLHIFARGNLSDAKSILSSVGSGTQVTGNYNGKDIGEIWGYRSDRLYQMDDFELDAAGKPILITLTAAESALNAGKQAYKLKATGKKAIYQPFLQNTANFRFGPGDVKFKDVNGDGEISNGLGTLADHGDLEKIGNSTPRYEYGFRFGADWKGVDISVFLQGVGSRQIWGNGLVAIPGYNSSDGAMPQALAGNYWTVDNPNAFYPAAYNNGVSNTTNNFQIQDRYLLNMAYLRLKNLTVGYTIPMSITNRAKISSVRVYGALENFITWDHLNGLPIDPEQIDGYSFWNTSNYNSGRTGASTPAFKSISVGVQVNF